MGLARRFDPGVSPTQEHVCLLRGNPCIPNLADKNEDPAQTDGCRPSAHVYKHWACRSEPSPSSLFRVPRSCAPSATPSQHLETCGGFTYELAGQAGLASSNPPAPASVTVTLPLPLYILAHRFPVYIHAHTHPHIEDSGARVEQPCLLVPSELGDHASLGCFQSGQKAG